MPEQRGEWNVLRMLTWATDYFEQHDIRSPRLSIEWLLAHVLGIRRLDLYLQFERPLSSEELDELRPLVKRRAHHEPLQYITGSTDFYSVVIDVNPSVLIPRQETEELVEHLLERIPKDTPLRVLDIGTGSGCIPIALKKERPMLEITAMDISEDALVTARSNAEKNGTEITFILGDFLADPPPAFDRPFHVIVSNPPYIPDSERTEIDEEVKAYEPSIALFTPDVRHIYKSIINFSATYLKSEKDFAAFLALEIHEELGTEIVSEFPENNWSPTLINDYGGKERFILSLIK